MTVSSLSAARHLCEYSGWSISNLKMQKILYMAHMLHMGRAQGEPLVTGHFEAWDYGPVHPTVYQKVKVFGSSPVKNVFHLTPGLGECAERGIIEEAYDFLKKFSSGQLVNITHHKGGAWYKNYIPGTKGVHIPNSDIVAEARKLVA